MAEEKFHKSDHKDWDSNSGAKTICQWRAQNGSGPNSGDKNDLSKDDESQLTVRMEISCSPWSLDRLTWIWIKLEPEGELLLKGDKTACWSCEGKA